MESLQVLKSRLRAVKNIGQITKAMEVVAATKMRKAQQVALNSRPYAFEALALLERLSRGGASGVLMPLTENRPVKTTLVVIVSSDRGLAGSFNSQVFRVTEAFLASDAQNGQPQHKYVFIAIGKKSGAYADKKALETIEKFQDWGDHAEPEEVEPLTQLAIGGFLQQRWDRVVTISTHFSTTLKQETLVRQIMPADFEKIRETVREIVPEHGRWADIKNGVAGDNGGIEYILEPSPAEALNALIPHLVKMQFYHLILEANASEHSARMVAMKNASDNAEELSGKITLDYNKARQAGITKEIIEITSTQSAMI